ncbi:hypothetical protein CATYP_06475 [Corynebacterium atypicum]|uniref:LUD domain-containing protein n=1 Tax=Corynebacterium atypicum TaxID=191610 RepID=A0ABM5QNB6_9CORY|nr:LUD domain-containing protein [Corynebacterium atypicum]AIG64312.1 hypothetical protein CATYP_06475 [Corynebacterium atypicum]
MVSEEKRNQEAKAEILKRIRDAQQLSGTPADVEIPRNYRQTSDMGRDELRELLVDRLVDYRADVATCSSDDLPATLGRVLGERKVSTVRYAEGLDKALFAEVDATCEPDSRDSDPHALNEVDAVVTDSHVSAAQTGTICLQSNPTNGRRALTLVPDRHVCIVHMDTVVYGVPEMVARLDPELPVTMISGPSATSDIELARVEGVHGPRDLAVIIVD